MDQLSIERIKQAHPKVRAELLALYTKANNALPKGIRLRLAYVYRSIAEQDALYKLVPKVTNAKGWQSIHNYGLAFDIVILYDKDNNGTFESASWAINEHWLKVVDIFKANGWEWGGDWKNFKDAPHFQKTFGFDWRTLQGRVQKDITIKDDNGITYPKI